MIVKPAPAPADPSKVCKTCVNYDPDVHVCCADDCIITEEQSKLWRCGSWEPKKEKLNVFSVSETIGMTPVNPMKVPLQPDGSLKMLARETIGASIVNPDGVTKLTFGGTSLQELAAKQKKQEVQFQDSACCFNCEHRDKMSLRCKLNISDAVLTVMRAQHESCGSWEPEQFHGVHLRVVDPEEDKKQKEALVQKCLIAKEKGWRRGYMMAELHMMCAAASQLMPERKPQWERLRNILEDALRAWWARNDQQESKA